MRATNNKINTSRDLVDSSNVSHCFCGAEPNLFELSERSCAFACKFQRYRGKPYILEFKNSNEIFHFLILTGNI